MSLCKDCVSGVVHEGTPEGKWEQIGGVNSYIATPTIEYPKDKVVLLLTDVFGPQLINSQLLADSFAKNGFMTIVPDYLINDPIPPDALNPGSTFDLGTWLQKHPAEITRPALNKVIAALKQRGIVRFAATGYCFGGRYVFDLAIDGLIQVAATSHPSLLKIPEDLEKYHALSRAPLLLNTCPTDQQFPPEAQTTADDIFAHGKFAPGYRREYFEGCMHGFAVRGDMGDVLVRKGKEGAFRATVEWFIEYL